MVNSTIFSVLLMAVLGLALPIAELSMGVKFMFNDHGCNNATILSPITWLIVSGSTGIVESALIIFVLVVFLGGDFEDLTMAFICPYFLSFLFHIAWAIVGSVILFRDNLNCSPSQLHDIFYASVIIRLLGVFFTIVTHNNFNQKG